MAIESIKSKEDGTRIVLPNDLIPSVNNVGDEAYSVTPSQIISGAVADGVLLKYMTLSIGDWNMNTTQQVVTPHGFADHTKIKTVSALIIIDGSSASYDFSSARINTETNNSYIAVTAINISLFRADSGFFDTTNFEDTGFNRGNIAIGYID